MDSFRWDENYVTGIEEVDTQHMQLVSTINRLGDLLARPEGSAADDIASVITELSDYSEFHFAEEEKLMRDAGIDPRHLEYQQREHESFINEIARMRGKATDGAGANGLLKFLVHWLAYHILGSDQSMARQILLIREGKTPADAYKADQRLGVRATEPLLIALNGLFQQVSERNRELYELNRTLEAKVEARTRELALANKHLEEISLTDALTGLPNRRHAMRRLKSEWDAGDGHLSCMMIDCDGFKQVNDTWGHDAGDAVLKALAETLKDGLRTDDLACRLGGDEFFVICAATGLDGALHLAEQLRATVGAMRVPAGAGHWDGSISVGVATRTCAMERIDDLIKAADEGVYRSKKGGRNKVSTTQR